MNRPGYDKIEKIALVFIWVILVDMLLKALCLSSKLVFQQLLNFVYCGLLLTGPLLEIEDRGDHGWRTKDILEDQRADQKIK